MACYSQETDGYMKNVTEMAYFVSSINKTFN